MSEAILHSAALETATSSDAVPDVSSVAEGVDQARMARIVSEHHAFVWRSLRRLGVPHGDVDDAAQKVFLVASRRLGSFAKHQERSFLFSTVIRIASNERRAQGRRRYAGSEDIDGYAHEAPSPEQAAAARALLDQILDPLPLELRGVFILFELEQMTVREIAATLDVPTGTAASRLRRARELVDATIARLRARGKGIGQ